MYDGVTQRLKELETVELGTENVDNVSVHWVLDRVVNDLVQLKQ